MTESKGVGKAPWYAGVYTGVALLAAVQVEHMGLIELGEGGVVDWVAALLISWPFFIFVVWAGLKDSTKITPAEEREYGNLYIPERLVPGWMRYWRYLGGLLLTLMPGTFALDLLMLK